MGLNGGPGIRHKQSCSFQVATADQAEADRYWNAILSHGGQPNMCGWCQDKWGVAWQFTPIAPTQAIQDPDPAAARRAFSAVMEIQKIDSQPSKPPAAADGDRAARRCI